MPPRLHRRLYFHRSRSHVLATSAIGESVPAPVSGPRYTNASVRATKATLPTSYCPHFVSSLAAIRKNPPTMIKFPDDCLSF
jgi:hypothetical protein